MEALASHVQKQQTFPSQRPLAWLCSISQLGAFAPRARDPRCRIGLEPGPAGIKRRYHVLVGLYRVVATVSCVGLPGIDPMCRGHLQKGLFPGETENQVMISFGPALIFPGCASLPVLAAGSGESPPKALETSLGSRKGNPFQHHTPSAGALWLLSCDEPVTSWRKETCIIRQK